MLQFFEVPPGGSVVSLFFFPLFSLFFFGFCCSGWVAFFSHFFRIFGICFCDVFFAFVLHFFCDLFFSIFLHFFSDLHFFCLEEKCNPQTGRGV